MQPDTVIRWHRRAFRQWWRWKSRHKAARPAISQEVQALIRRLSRENILWSAERIHGQLVLLGYAPPWADTIRKYMIRPKGKGHTPQSWLTFLRNHIQV
jgi:putative transposase